MDTETRNISRTLKNGRLAWANKIATSETMDMSVIQTVHMRISPQIDQLGKIWKINLMKLERGKWKGAPGIKAANEAVDMKRKATIIKMLLRVIPMTG